jgi:hypothetical protein
MSQNVKLFLGCLLVLISRLPFLNAGFGVEEDSWGIAVAALNTRETGVFEASRLPGHPFNEMFYVAMWGLSSWWFNFSSALMSVLLFFFSAKVLLHFNLKNAILSALAVVFVPVVFINSTCTVDYLWSVALMVGSFYFLLSKNWPISVLFFSMSVGCRLTNGVFIVPFLWFFREEIMLLSVQRRLALLFSCGLLCLLWYLPVINVYGPGFFTYSDQFPYPSWFKIGYKATLGVWGTLGCMALLMAGWFLFSSGWRKRLQNPYAQMTLILCALFALQYFMLPQKSAYWIQIIPFVIFFLAMSLNPRQVQMVMAILIFSPFLLGINLTDPYRGSESSSLASKFSVNGQEIFIDPFIGLMQSDYSKRIRKLEYGKKVLGYLSTMNKPTVVICGWWYNQLLITKFDNPIPDYVELKFYCDESSMAKWKENGAQIFYLHEQDLYNDLYAKISSTRHFAERIKI